MGTSMCQELPPRIGLSARQGHMRDLSTKEDASRCLGCEVQRARRETEAQSRFWEDQTKLRDNLAIYGGNVYS